MKIDCYGDLFLGGDFELNDFDFPIMDSTSINIANLEAPFVNDFTKNRSDKSILFCKSKYSSKIANFHFDALTLANNHITDYGNHGVEETKNILDHHKIKYTGAGDFTNYNTPINLYENWYLLSYCESDKKYLKNPKPPSENEYGVNILDFEKIEKLLKDLPSNSKVILYIHWGKEHVYLPPYKIIEYAKKILEMDKVFTIIGMHPHVVQGIIKHKNKLAYLSIGNFFFPNFKYTKQSILLENQLVKAGYSTFKYHRVLKPTYKKWLKRNRVSMKVTIDTDTHEISHRFILQDKNKVDYLTGVEKVIWTNKIKFLSKLYTKKAYKYISYIESLIYYNINRFYKLFFLLIQKLSYKSLFINVGNN